MATMGNRQAHYDAPHPNLDRRKPSGENGLPGQLRALPEGAALAPVLQVARGGAAVTGAQALALWDTVACFPTMPVLRRLTLLIDVLALVAESRPRPP